MRILIAPLNWGLGHATRCIPLISQHLAQGDEVVLGGDGDSLTLLRKRYPTLSVLPLASLSLRYSCGQWQVGAMLRALPSIIKAAIRDHAILDDCLCYEHFDLIISDNRFGLFTRKVRSVYMTHQLTIPLPRAWRWLEPLAAWVHRRVISHFDECWVPDYPDGAMAALAEQPSAPRSLAGRLSHPFVLPPNVRYIGPLSRFTLCGEVQPDAAYDVVAVLSGLEPHRTLFEKQICRQYEHQNGADDAPRVLIVRGKVGAPPTVLRHGNITFVPWLDDNHLLAYMLGARQLVMRSGYSSVMDMAVLGLKEKVDWHPTPGQPEQEYLAEWLVQAGSHEKCADT